MRSAPRCLAARSRTRAGNLLFEAAIALAGLSAVAVIATGVSVERRDASRGEARAAALETAQNLLARIRRHDGTALPTGWTSERHAMGAGAVEIIVRGEGVVLATVTAAAPGDKP